MEKVIELNNLVKVYPLPKKTKRHEAQGLAALGGVSFVVEKGEIFGILGPNGAGKTTTLEIIEGLKRQTSGSAKVLGFDNLTESEEIKKRIGVQLQASDYLPYITLGELLRLFGSLYAGKNDAAQARFAAASERQSNGLQKKLVNQNAGKAGQWTALLSLVGLEDKEHDLVQNLSGGQKQRFTIATSLVNQPDILFLDEPTTGLDPHARRQMWKLIKDINGQGITVILTTHYMEEAEFLCRRVAIMDKGKILGIDEPQKLIDDLSHTTQVSFFAKEKFDTGILQSLPEIIKIFSEYPKMILEIKSLDHISAIIGLLKKNNIAFSGFTVKTATLEDVYLNLTGREFEE